VSEPSAADDWRALYRSSKALRWLVGGGATIMVAIGLVLFFLLTQATRNREAYEQVYQWLVLVNIAVAALLAVVIVWMAVRLVLRMRRGKFGSRLLLRLALVFALVGFGPGLLIYVVSYQFVSRSIESWFDVKVEGALEAGLNLGRATLDALSNDLSAKTRSAARELAELSDATAAIAVGRLREQLAASDVVLWSPGGQVVASAGVSRFELNPERPSAQQLRILRTQRVSAVIEGLDDQTGLATSSNARIKVLAVVAGANIGLVDEPRLLQVTQSLPSSLVANAIAVQEANREYQERALGRQGLRRMYIGTLTLSLFLAVFGSVLVAVLLGNQIARPLLLLADGVRQVAAGDLRPKAALQGKDELDGLTRSFAAMTQQISDARFEADRNMEQLVQERDKVQTILDNQTAGVVVLDAEGHVVSSNPAATRILRAPLAAFEGQALGAMPGLAAFAASVQDQFAGFMGARALHGAAHWQQAFDLDASGTQGGPSNIVNLVARGALLPDGARLLVFDDISEIVSAQRAQAWGEVARRLAHEIKNPLTPIQLSAERMEVKLKGKLPEAEQLVLARSVKTIIDQVDAMKRLVNEFRDYARLPSADLKPVDLNAVVADVLQLYAPENSAVPVAAELDPGLPPIKGDAQQLRQVLHNLLQNAQDATLGAPRAGPDASVLVRTQLSESGQRVRLSVIDHGSGFAEHILKRAFEPYVTTKDKGTGLGLAVVKKVADEHGARVELSNRSVEGRVAGAQVSLSFAVAA
jgi:nitrogen fixation/metabolism regulation signal transduction histidine kinase